MEELEKDETDEMVCTLESPIMPSGPVTYTGRYPGYMAAQAMAAFLAVPREPGRPAYEETLDFWKFDAGGYALVAGCFAEPDRTPVVAVTSLVVKPEIRYALQASQLLMREKFVLQQSAHSTKLLGADAIGEAVASGKLRQLRPSGIRPIPDFVNGRELQGAAMRGGTG